MNHVVLSAGIVEAKPLRYTPAGLPALDLRLEHESSVEEAGSSRQVKAVIKAVALGFKLEHFAGVDRDDAVHRTADVAHAGT